MPGVQACKAAPDHDPKEGCRHQLGRCGSQHTWDEAEVDDPRPKGASEGHAHTRSSKLCVVPQRTDSDGDTQFTNTDEQHQGEGSQGQAGL